MGETNLEWSGTRWGKSTEIRNLKVFHSRTPPDLLASQSFAHFLHSRIPSHLQRFNGGLLVNFSSRIFLLRTILESGCSNDEFIHS